MKIERGCKDTDLTDRIYVATRNNEVHNPSYHPGLAWLPRQTHSMVSQVDLIVALLSTNSELDDHKASHL